MINRRLGARLPIWAFAIAAFAGTAQGQVMQNRWPGDPPPNDPGAASAPAASPAKPKAAKKPAGPAHVIACSGAFAKGSSHLQLATVFGSENVTFTDVDGPEGTRIPGSVLFPKDPKRRLEVIWNDAAGRRDTQVIDINGQSAWTGPKGLKLGMPLAAVEKLNGRPFRLTGFGGDNAGSVLGWNDGALAKLPGDCAIGMRFAPDASATATAEGELSSDDASLRAAKPKVVEILIGYPQ
jgi:hypothetical protein